LWRCMCQHRAPLHRMNRGDHEIASIQDLVRFLNVRMNGIGPALQQWGMGSAKVLAKHSAAWAELLSWRSLASLKTR
jgi:hypothetical protein